MRSVTPRRLGIDVCNDPGLMTKLHTGIACLLFAFIACKENTPERANPSSEPLRTATALPQGGPEQETPPPEAQPDVPPPRDPNLSRTFQGDLLSEIQLADGRRGTLRYTSDAEHARVQLQGLGPGFDLLIDEEHIFQLDHEARTYRSQRLEDLEATIDRQPTVRQDVSGGRTTHAGLTCQQQTLRSEQLRVEACVRGLPGDFELGILETMTNVRTPDWLVALLRQGQIPIKATGFDANGRQTFTFAVTRYAPDVLPDAVFELPETYRAENAPPGP